MLEPVPASAKYPYQAFALAPADAEEVRRLAHLVVDYVASAEARLRTMAADATSARTQGLVLLSEMSRSLAYA